MRSRREFRSRPRVRPRSWSAASTGRRSARSRPRFVDSGRRSPTRARASNTRASTSSARKARRNDRELLMAQDRKAVARREARVRRAVKSAAGSRLRLCVHRSSKHIYAQVIDDRKGETLAAASSLEKPMRSELKTGADIAAAKAVGKLVAERALAKGIKEVVLDRGRYLFHGRVKALADAAREGGLNF